VSAAYSNLVVFAMPLILFADSCQQQGKHTTADAKPNGNK